MIYFFSMTCHAIVFFNGFGWAGWPVCVGCWIVDRDVTSADVDVVVVRNHATGMQCKYATSDVNLGLV